jgi:hypothetical protein
LLGGEGSPELDVTNLAVVINVRFPNQLIDICLAVLLSQNTTEILLGDFARIIPVQAIKGVCKSMLVDCAASLESTGDKLCPANERIAI